MIHMRRFALPACLLLIGLFYSATSPFAVTSGHGGIDGAELAVAATHLGVAHPPGYGLFVGLSAPFARLTPSNPIAGLMAFNAGLAVLCCGVLAWAAWRASGRLSAGLVAAIGLGLSFTFWSQAIIYETYSLMTLLFALLLTLALSRTRSPWLVFVTGHLAGIALTHHLTALVWLPVLLILSGYTRRELLRWGVGLLTGLWPVLLLLALSARGGLPDWGEVSHGLPDLFAHVTGRAFVGYLAPFTLVGWLNALADSLALLWHDMTAFGVALAGLGAIRVAVMPGGRRALLAFFALLAGLSAVASVYTAADTSTVYRLPITVMACWFAGQSVMPYRRLAGIGAAAALAALLLSAHMVPVALTGDASQREFVADLRDLPPDSLIVTADTETTFRLWYACDASALCGNNWLVLNTNLMQFDWYVRRIMTSQPGLSAYTPDDVAGWLAQDAWRDRPIASDLVFFGLRGRTQVRSGGWQVWRVPAD